MYSCIKRRTGARKTCGAYCEAHCHDNSQNRATSLEIRRGTGWGHVSSFAVVALVIGSLDSLTTATEVSVWEFSKVGHNISGLYKPSVNQKV